MHALMFFYIAIYEMLNGKPVKGRLLSRVIHHLMDLREFINDETLNDLVNHLLTNLRTSRYIGPRTKRATDIRKWIVKNLADIMEFAERYGRKALFNELLLKVSHGNWGSGNVAQGSCGHAGT